MDEDFYIMPYKSNHGTKTVGSVNFNYFSVTLLNIFFSQLHINYYYHSLRADDRCSAVRFERA